MPLTPPTVAELVVFRNAGPYAAGAETDYATMLLQQSTDAVWVTTGMDSYPDDDRAERITKNAIMQFSLWLGAQDDHRDEINSPYSSERIGSYSYSKMQQASRGMETGIYWLDLLFQMLGFYNEENTSLAWSNSENVFNPCELTYSQQEYLELLARPDSPYLGW